MTNPFKTSPFQEDYYRYCRLRPLGYNVKPYLFAEALARPVALKIAKSIAQTFNVSVKVESLSVRQFWIYYERDIDDLQQQEPVLEWAPNYEELSWAVILYESRKYPLVDLWECWFDGSREKDGYPFDNEKSFDDWFEKYKGGNTTPQLDPALKIWIEKEEEAENGRNPKFEEL